MSTELRRAGAPALPVSAAPRMLAALGLGDERPREVEGAVAAAGVIGVTERAISMSRFMDRRASSS